MQLLFLTPQQPFPPRQGATIRNYNLMRLLAQRHAIDLLTFLAPGEKLDDSNPLHQLCRRIATVAQPARPTRQRARDTLLAAVPDMALRLESQLMHELVQQWTRDHAYDVVQIEGIELAQYGRRIARRERTARPALVFDDHNCEYLLQQRSAFTDLRSPRRWLAAAYSLVQWQKLRHYEAAIVNTMDATFAVSEADRAALVRVAPAAAITVAPNGIDPGNYDPQALRPQVTPPLLVFTGKMDYHPNIDAALWFAQEVLPQITASAPDVRFQIVGMNPHRRLDSLRNHPNIEIVGAVDDIRPYIYGAAVYVIPMRVGGGTRFKALEAMASGAAIVSTGLGVEGIGVGDEQQLLLADDPASFAAAITRLLADLRTGGSLRRQLGVTARAFVEAHYDWRQIVPRLETMYDQIVAKRNKN